MSRIEYGLYDYKPEHIEDQCINCIFKQIVKTACCGKQLCWLHHKDYNSCILCEEIELYEEDGFIINRKTICCPEHNQLKYCDNCNEYYCTNHNVHACTIWYIHSETPSYNQRVVDFQKNSELPQ